MHKLLADKIKCIPRNWITDKRGGFLKLISGLESDLPAFSSEFYITSALPGMSKGGHYHRIANEWFTLIKGSCILTLRDIYSGEILKLNLSANEPMTVFVPIYVAHIFFNNGNDEFILSAYSSELYDPADTINIEIF